MIRKIASPKYLNKLIVPLEDTSELSPNYFNVVEYPEVLQAGKNLLRIQGTQNLEINEQMQEKIEIYYLGNTISNLVPSL